MFKRLFINGNFDVAIRFLRLVEQGYRIEYMTSKDIRERRDWTHPCFLVDWFLESDFHVVLGQGFHNTMFGIWKPNDCVEQLTRLEYHCGFPSFKNLRDPPVFNGNKFDYLCAASEFCNPSFKLPLNVNEQCFHRILDSAKIFMEKFRYYEGESQKGFIMKAPFVQNQNGFRSVFFNTLEELEARVLDCYKKDAKHIGKLHVRVADVFPYLIIQPRMIDTSESKVILLGGEARYIHTTVKRGITGTKPGKISQEQLFEFVQKAWLALTNETDGAFLGDGLCRVDCFRTAQGNIVVNEFENLDANFSGPSIYECATPTFLRQYFITLLNRNLFKKKTNILCVRSSSYYYAL